MEFQGILVGLAMFVAILVIAIVVSVQRRKAFEELARRFGMTYRQKDRRLPTEFKFLDGLRQGRNRFAQNVLQGDYRGHPVMFFDFHYTTGSGKNQQQHCESFFMLRQERHFPELRIYPENLLHKFGQMLGFEDINFESLEFSRTFCVRSANKKFAYDICHPRMMEFLLKHPKICLEIEQHFVALGYPRALKPEECPAQLDLLVQVRELFPRYLYESESGARA